MIRPPFTVLIVKDGHQPITTRITRRLALTGVVVFLIMLGMTTYGIYWHVTRLPSLPNQSFIPQTNDTPTYTVNEETLSGYEDNIGQTQFLPMIDELTVNQITDETVEIGFTIMNPPEMKELYVWIILNPGASSFIYPRSPLFRGMPVDYRNGIRYNGNYTEPIRVEFHNMKIGVDFDTFRILAYEPEDVIVIDKTYTIQHPDRM